MLNDWLEHRNVLQELLETIDDEHINFKPWVDATPLGELALHIAGWNDVFTSMVMIEEMIPPNFPNCKTMEEVHNTVKAFTEKTKTIFKLLTDADLEAENTSSHSKLQGQKKDNLWQCMIMRFIIKASFLFMLVW